MVRNILIIIICFLSLELMAQKPQRIAYIDMEYILENVPEYAEAQAKLNQKVQEWQKKLDDIKRDIEVLKTDLSNEKALLTKELIEEREEDIEIRQLDLKNLQAAYFGPKGDLFLMRKQLVKPIQDQVYIAVQEIAKRKKYDMILDKSSDLIMLYTNSKFDESETVLNRIVKNRKTKAVEEKRNEKLVENAQVQERTETKAQEKQTKNDALQARIKAQQDARAKKREELKKAAEERNKKRKAEIERRRKEKENKLKGIQNTEKKNDTLTKSTLSNTVARVKDTVALKKLDSAKNAKRAALLERARLAKEVKEKRRKEIIRAKEEKRKKRLEELEKRKKKKKDEEKETNNN